jgi:outer membrane lipoprotein SlyB
MKRTRLCTISVAAVAGICAATAALPQTIRIPDFRQASAVSTLGPGEACKECGRILSIRETRIDRKPAPVNVPGGARGPVGHNFVGAVVYLPLGGGSADRPYAGGVGTPEMQERFGQTTYEITVRMDDGALRSVHRSDGSQFRVGDRVRALEGGELQLVVQ